VQSHEGFGTRVVKCSVECGFESEETGEVMPSLLLDAASFGGLVTRKGPCGKALIGWFRDNWDRNEYASFSTKAEWGWRMDAVGKGAKVEDATEIVQAATQQLQAAKKELTDTANQIERLSNVVLPMLAEKVTQLRSARMGLVSEVNASLGALRDIRQFFIESDYEKEVKRLEQFLGLCDRLKQLRQDGTLDVVSDVVIRLATQEVSK
jgi:hypothetical protein